MGYIEKANAIIIPKLFNQPKQMVSWMQSVTALLQEMAIELDVSNNMDKLQKATDSEGANFAVEPVVESVDSKGIITEIDFGNKKKGRKNE